MSISGPTTPILDSFDRSDTGPPLSANWTDLANGNKVVSNTAAGNATGFNFSYWNPGTFAADEEAYITIATKPASGDAVGVYIRMKDVGSVATVDGYLLGVIPQAGTDIIRMQRVDNAVATTLGADFSQEVSAGDKIMLRAIGSTLEAWYCASGGSWTLLGTRTDSTYAAGGYLGLLIQNTVARVNDFGGGTYVIPLTDAGTGSDAISLAAEAALTDTGSGMETIEASAAISIADSASGSDAIDLSATVGLADTGAGADSIAIQVTVDLSETGTGADDGPMLGLSITDTAAGNEALAVSAAVNLVETGTADDVPELVVSIGLAEAGGGDETVAIAATLTQTDDGTGSDGIGVDTGGDTLLGLSDDGIGADTISIEVVINLAESGVGADQLAALVSIALEDLGAGADGFVYGASISLTEIAISSEVITISATVAQTDTGTGTDNISLDNGQSRAGSGLVTIGSLGSGSFGIASAGGGTIEVLDT